MKHILAIFAILSLALSACSLPFGAAVGQPTATELQILLPSVTATQAATAEPSSTATDTPIPTNTELPSETPQPSATATNSATPTEPPFDPNSVYGAPALFDNLDDDRNWADSSGDLPDSDFIRLALGGSKLHVTGKPSNFDTWWYSWPKVDDFFIQMKAVVGSCSGQQAYGLILRGPATNETSAHGYIFTFSCDGSYRLVRLDRTSPYTTLELIPWTPSDHINSGSDKTNVMGVALLGDEITLYANGFKLEKIEDDRFSSGRFGVFVNAGPPGNFTFSVDEWAYWILG